jgi:hypothetical protein
MSKSLTTEEFIEKARIVHEDKYDYSKSKYTGSKSKALIICPIHGEFWQRPNDHLSGKGCRNCGYDARRMSFSEFIERSVKVHGDKYDYSLVEYASSRGKVCVTCPVHGEFWQKADNHTTGSGCSECANDHHGHWSRSDYIRMANRRSCILYVIKCKNNNEEFYKIGITVKSIKRRFRRGIAMPYDYNVIHEIKGKAGHIWDLEKELHRKHKEFKYKPKLSFGGETECFSEIIPELFAQ